MNSKRISERVLGFLFFGTVWGFSEATFGDWLYANDVHGASIYLTIIAFIILSAARKYLPYIWTGTAIGIIAMLFKLVNIPFFACHLLAIALLGTGFDIVYVLVTRLHIGRFRLPLIGITANYIGRALFALLITYVIRYQYWTIPGISKVIDYIFISGSISAVGCMFAVPLGNKIADSVYSHPWPKLHPRFSSAVLFLAIVCIWVVQQTI